MRRCSERRAGSSRLVYATSCTRPWRKRYSGAGRRRTSTMRSSRISSESAGTTCSRGSRRSSSGSPKPRPMALATDTTSRVFGDRRSRRACSAPCTTVGMTTPSPFASSVQAPPSRRRSAPRSIRSCSASSRKNGLPPARSASSSTMDAGSSRLRQRAGQRAARVGVERAQLELVVAVRVELAGALAEPPGRGVAVGAVQQDDAELRLLRQHQQLLEQLQRRVVRPLQVVDREAHAASRRRGRASRRGRRRRSASGRPRG